MIKLFYNLMFPITTYAEIHYRLFPGFPSLLFRSVPEIIADVPHRVTGDKLPIFLLIKDAHHFPVTINSLRIIQKNKTIFEKQLNITIKEKWDWHLIEFDNPFMNNEVNQFFVEINFTTLNNNKQHKVINDSFPHFLLLPHFLLRKKKPFIVFTSDNELPGKSLCWWGDIHTHSEFTEDQVEFGSPLPFLHKAAKIIGLDFAVITDHSYDLDDEPDNYLKNSSGAPKFAKMCKAVNELSNAPIFIAGEEVSWGNCKNENIHAVIINPQMLYKGYGDSGERYFLNSPTHKLNEEIKKKSTEEIIFAAHPFKKIKKSQKFFLKRGKWHNEDLLNKNIDGWQILNGKLDSGFRSGKKRWITALLSGEKKLISAGNDAHGNLNLFRQVKIPFINTEDNYYHQFGYFRTGLIHNNLSLNKKNILQTMRNGRIIVSSGPFINLCVKYDGQLFHIGDTFKIEKIKKMIEGKNKCSLDIHFLSTPEYWVISKINVIYGNLKKGIETDIFNYENSNKEVIFEYKNSLEFIPNDVKQAYFRIEAETETGHFVLSNPIWYEL